MTTTPSGACGIGVLTSETAEFYRSMVRALQALDVPFLVGGAYAFARYTDIVRHTKDFDVFIRELDLERAMAALGDAGCSTERTFPHWLAKAYCGDDFIDVIFGSGNGMAVVDDEWFEHAVDETVLGMPVRLIPPEEMLWSKAFVMERERYDGADINHLLRAVGAALDWSRVIRRFGDLWRVLLNHLVLFGFVYPSDASNVPAWVMRELIGRLEAEIDAPRPTERVCRGTLISREQYLYDIEEWGYVDPRLCSEGGNLTQLQIGDWTAAIDEDH